MSHNKNNFSIYTCSYLIFVKMTYLLNLFVFKQMNMDKLQMIIFRI